jgi:hypothetical protein
MLYPQGESEPFSIVHQYDRDPVWNYEIKGRHKESASATHSVIETSRKWGRK